MTALAVRLLWKEYRQLRAVWLSLAGLTLFIAGLMAIRLVTPHADFTRTLLLTMPTMFVIAAGAMLFAAEHENETDRFLMQWNVSATGLLICKIVMAFTGATTLAVWTTLLVEYWNLPNPRLYGRTQPLDNAVLLGLLAVGFTWSAAASVFLKRVLTSVVIGGVSSLVFYRAEDLFVDMFPQSDAQADAIAYLWTLGLATAVAAIACVVAFSKRMSGRWTEVIKDGNESTTIQAAPTSLRSRPPRSVLTALLWKDWRQSRGWLLIAGGLLAYVILAASLVGLIRVIFGSTNAYVDELARWLAGPIVLLASGPIPLEFNDSVYAYLGALLVACTCGFSILAFLLGAQSYAGDQRQSLYRFLSNRGTSPTLVWCSKQIIFLSLVVGFAVATGSVWNLHWKRLPEGTPGWVPFAVFGAFATAQIFAILIPQMIVVFAVAVIVNLMLLGYSLGLTVLDVPFWILAGPLAAAPIVSTFFLTPDWMAESRTWLARGRQLLAITLPLTAVVTATCCYRAYEIPEPPGADTFPRKLPPLTQAQIDVGEQYMQILQTISERSSIPVDVGDIDPEDSQAVEHRRLFLQNEALLDPLLEISKSPDLVVMRPPNGLVLALDSFGWNLVDLCLQTPCEILFGAAEVAKQKGDFSREREILFGVLRLSDHALKDGFSELRTAAIDERNLALRLLTLNAANPETTVADIRLVIEAGSLTAPVSADELRGWIIADAETTYGRLDWLSALIAIPRLFPEEPIIAPIYFATPWELTRARRLTDQVRIWQLERINRGMPRSGDVQNSHSWIDIRPFKDWYLSTPFIRRIHQYSSDPFQSADWLESNDRQSLALLVALAWWKEHGALPADLQNAAQQYAGTSIIDPASGRSLQINDQGDFAVLVQVWKISDSGTVYQELGKPVPLVRKPEPAADENPEN